MSKRQTQPLADRVASALSNDTPSELIAALIVEAEKTRSAAEEQRQCARARALNPVASISEASTAKQECDTRRFEIERLDAALAALSVALENAKDRERDGRRRAIYDRVMVERDALVEELKEVYAPIEHRLGDLMRRIEANDAALAHINGRLPSGAYRLASVDETARGRTAGMLDPDRRLALDLTRTLRLPRFEIDALDPYSWPAKSA